VHDIIESFLTFQNMSIGVPIKVLHEAEGHTITCETINGETFRGKLVEAEDNMNCQISNVHVTYRDGRTNELDLVFIRGSKIRFLILPDMLKNAPMFKRGGKTGGGAAAGGITTGARGKATLMRGASKLRLKMNISRYMKSNPTIIVKSFVSFFFLLLVIKIKNRKRNL